MFVNLGLVFSQREDICLQKAREGVTPHMTDTVLPDKTPVCLNAVNQRQLASFPLQRESID